MTSPTPPEFLLPESDVRAIVRLLGEITMARGSLAAAKEQLMTGLCALIGADAWIWGIGQHDPQNVPFYISFNRGNIDDDRGRFCRESDR